MFTILRLIELSYKKMMYEQGLMFYIDEEGRQHQAGSPSDLISRKNISIKIEGMERFNLQFYKKGIELAKKYNHSGPVTCHLFYADKNSPSFGVHTDPDDVIILCLEGIKTMVIDNQYVEINQGEEVYIPHGTPHQALNDYKSLTLSYGLERFLEDKIDELDVLPKND